MYHALHFPLFLFWCVYHTLHFPPFVWVSSCSSLQEAAFRVLCAIGVLVDSGAAALSAARDLCATPLKDAKLAAAAPQKLRQKLAELTAVLQ